MEITLSKANLEDASTILEMQIIAFMPLLEKYRDYDTSPANESIDRIVHRLNQEFTDYYFINHDETPVGAIRIVTINNWTYRISPIFILPAYQGRGIAQQVFTMIEEMYSDAKSWELDTILQETGNCYLYEKLGYKRTGEIKVINERMTIVFYEKHVV